MPGIYEYGPYMLNTAGNGVITTTTVRSWDKIQVSNSTPAKRVKPQGIQLILQPTSFIHYRYFIQRGYAKSKVGLHKYPSEYTPDVSYAEISAPDQVTYARLAWGRALEKLQNNKFDTATFLGELPETIRWIAGAAKEMVDAYLAIKRGRWTQYLPRREIVSKPGKRRVRKYLRIRGPRYRVVTFTRRDGSKYSARLSLDGRLSKRYLEWRFAVTPLVQEVGNLMDAWYEQAVNPMISHVHGIYTTNSPISGYFQTGTRRVRVRASGYYEIKTSAKALQKWGGLNLVHTLWNLLPLSFMVDRFIPIGSFLGNLDAEMGVTWKSFTTSYANIWELKTTKPNTLTYSYEVGSAHGQYYERRREKSTQVMPTGLSFDKASFQTALDALALARSILLK